VSINQELTEAQVTEQVRALARQRKIRWSAHAEDRMELRGISKDQVCECLLKGTYVEAPCIANKQQFQYEFRMQATVDGDQINVIASLIPQSHVTVITSFWLN
jgi:hypothetical protein